MKRKHYRVVLLPDPTGRSILLIESEIVDERCVTVDTVPSSHRIYPHLPTPRHDEKHRQSNTASQLVFRR